ncbi:secondary thiamine-phosphate synthase enzyme YjbQ [Solimonas marina]|uniref:YjbQ family protein n=1 Tax=Solimonas marina TaxID=2714601 RepID=A0A970B5Q3_9GAMM|nr:secondary thiamine-phosphate synthase enzyme YjbQ [Solimonas marina]NKF21830.1 YjbQ family protein [Solimonas marina]
MDQQILQIETAGRDFVEITAAVQRAVAASDTDVGLCHLFLRHTSASLCITENAAPAVRVDLETWAGELAPDSHSRYRHDDEGPDDMPAHIRSLVAGIELTVPIRDGALLLGTWQGIYVWEHRHDAHRRSVVVTVHGERRAR